MKTHPIWEKMKKQIKGGQVPMLTKRELREYIKTLPDEVKDFYKAHPEPLYFRGKPICVSGIWEGIKKAKQWFDDWHLETKWVGKYRRLILKLPHAKTRQKTFNYYEEDMRGRFEDFESILRCCFDQIQQDHGGYKNAKYSGKLTNIKGI